MLDELLAKGSTPLLETGFALHSLSAPVALLPAVSLRV